jgi:hypothetical protein
MVEHARRKLRRAGIAEGLGQAGLGVSSDGRLGENDQ